MTATATAHPFSNDFFAPLKARAPEIEARYRDLTPISAALHERAKTRLPGGYTRDSVMRRPYAPYIASGAGATLIDRDGREITDMWFNATSLPLGHADGRVVAAVDAQLKLGSAYFAPTESEIELADVICDRLPSAERVRFANSGSEAVMFAVRFARAFTGRDLVIKFEGSYHGSYDDVYWSVSPPGDRSGAPDRPAAVPESAGLTSSAGRVTVLRYNDVDSLEQTIGRHGDEIAAVIVEPVANRMGLIAPKPGFLRRARELCDAHGAVLIFDEVIVFRLGLNGAQGLIGVTPDLTTLGKIMGGGYPVGAIAGRADILALSEPGRASRVSHAGTFNANPITMAAGKATLEALTPDAFAEFDAAGEKIRSRLREMCAGLPIQVTGDGSLFKISATAEEITDYRTAATADREWQEIAAMALLNEGFLFAPSLHGCVSTATTDDHVESFLGAFASVLGA
jgi:glutamate-1-semialdehyde 2,1-aminomutase